MAGARGIAAACMGGTSAWTVRCYADVARGVLATIAAGDNPAEAKRKIRGEMIFAEMFDEYMERHAKVNKRSWAQDLQRFNAYLRSQHGNKKLSSIDRRDIRAIHERLAKCGERTVANRVLALVSIVYAKAIEWEHATSNPAAGIKLKKNSHAIDSYRWTSSRDSLNHSPRRRTKRCEIIFLLCSIKLSV
jgi:hypothetical protein